MLTYQSKIEILSDIAQNYIKEPSPKYAKLFLNFEREHKVLKDQGISLLCNVGVFYILFEAILVRLWLRGYFSDDVFIFSFFLAFITGVLSYMYATRKERLCAKAHHHIIFKNIKCKEKSND